MFRRPQMAKTGPHAAGMRESRGGSAAAFLTLAGARVPPVGCPPLSSSLFLGTTSRCLVKLENPDKKEENHCFGSRITGKIGPSHAAQPWRTARAPTASRLATTSRTFAVPLAFQWFSANPPSHRPAATPRVLPESSSRRASHTQNTLTSTKTSKPSKPRRIGQ
jgi:hypothetical protein